MPICLCADYVSFLSIRLELNIMTKQYGSERSHANVSLLESLLAPEYIYTQCEDLDCFLVLSIR